MGDDESRREDARREVLIDKAIRSGKINYCHRCGDQDWVDYIDIYDDSEPVPLCHSCAKDYKGIH